MKYDKYKYIYLPRPEKKIAPASLSKFDNGTYLGQPKLNGSAMLVFTNGEDVILMNRHKEKINHKLDLDEIKSLHRGEGWMVLCGEYMNKNKKDENNKPWNIKFVIFDILVYNNNHMLRSSFEFRYELLKEIYPDNPTKILLHQITENCFRVESVYNNFAKIYKTITDFDMYEGFVFKMRKGPLENGVTKQNNTRTQLKCRKPTKNYAF